MIGQRNVTFDTVGKGQAWGHGTPDFDALSGRGITEEILKALSVAGPPSCASVALRRRLARSQQAQNICITFSKRRPNVFDVGPTLYKCFTNVLCLLGCEQLMTDKGDFTGQAIIWRHWRMSNAKIVLPYVYTEVFAKRSPCSPNVLCMNVLQKFWKCSKFQRLFVDIDVRKIFAK